MTSTTTWHDTANEGFFGPMSPDGWVDNDDVVQNVFPPFSGSDRSWSKSPNSLLSDYSPPPLVGLPIPYSTATSNFAHHGAFAAPVQMETDVPPIQTDSASNSPASDQVQTPPEMNPSVDQQFDMTSNPWPHSSNHQSHSSQGTMEESWEIVPRQSSVISLDSPVENPRSTFGANYVPTQPENSAPIPRANLAFTGQDFANLPLRQGPHSTVSQSSSEPSVPLASVTPQTGSMTGFPHSSFPSDEELLSMLQAQGQDHQPWSTAFPRDSMSWDAKSDVLMFGPSFCQTPTTQAPVTQDQLRSSISSTAHSLSPDPTSSVVSGSPMEQYVSGPHSASQELSFALHGANHFGHVQNTIADPSLFMDSTLQSMQAPSQLQFNYMPGTTTFNMPVAPQYPTAPLNAAFMDPASETALLNSAQMSNFPNLFAMDSPPAIAPKACDSPGNYQAIDTVVNSSPQNRSGGRQLGSHLAPEKRRDANTMRDIKACWSCAFQRDKCGEGDPCPRCAKRCNKANGPHPQLACDRTPLWELVEYFLPSIMTSIHTQQALKDFVYQHTTGWTNVRICLRLIPGRGLPAMPCEAYEFVPKTIEPQRQFQYFKNSKTGMPLRSERPSPPLGMVQIENRDKDQYTKYIDDIIQNYFPAFAQMYCSDDGYDFNLRLLELLRNLKPEAKDEKDILHDVRRLIVVTYIMGHTLVLEEANRATVLPTLRHARPAIEYGTFCSPRVVNRQLKYLFCQLHTQYMSDVYKKLQQMLKKSKQWPPAKWVAAFAAMLGLAMVHEDTQKTVHLLADYKVAAEGWSLREAEKAAGRTCEAIDVKFSFVTALFMRRSSKGENPIVHRDNSWWSTKLDRNASIFAEGVKKLVSDNYTYLVQQQKVPSDRQGNFTARIVGRFLTTLLDQN
ncbi:hypothetical protein HDK77DRAFT_27056 [Phyllosticta capitalensis]